MLTFRSLHLCGRLQLDSRTCSGWLWLWYAWTKAKRELVEHRWWFPSTIQRQVTRNTLNNSGDGALTMVPLFRGLSAEMRCDLADYAGTGRQPSGSCLASLRGPRLTINFWTTTLVSLQYPLGLILSYFTVTRIPLVSSTSTPNPKSRAHGHLIISTFSPWFLVIYPSIFLDLFSIPLPSPTVISLPFCPDHWLHFYATRRCAVLIPCDYLLFLLYSLSRYK